MRACSVLPTMLGGFLMLFHWTLWRVWRENKYCQAHVKEIKTKTPRGCDVLRVTKLERSKAEAWLRSLACHVACNRLVIVTGGNLPFFCFKRCQGYVYPTQFVLWLVSKVKWNQSKEVSDIISTYMKRQALSDHPSRPCIYFPRNFILFSGKLLPFQKGHPNFQKGLQGIGFRSPWKNW